MKIIDRYILKEFLSLFSLTLLSLISIYLLIDFFERIDDFFENNAPLAPIAKYFLFKIPLITYTVIPFSTLIATILSLSILSRHMEITAMRSLGIAHFYIIQPILISSLFISFLTLFINETITPYTSGKVKAIEARWIEGLVNSSKDGTSQNSIFQSNKIWLRGEDGFFSIDLIDSQKGILRGFTLFKVDKDFFINTQIDAKEVVWEGSHWNFKDATINTFFRDGTTKVSKLPEMVMSLPESLEDFRKVERSADEMGFQELSEYIKKLRKEGYSGTRYTVDLYKKLSYPFSSFIMALIAIPFSMIRLEKGGASAGIGLSIIIGFTFWIISAVSSSLGYGEVLSPFLSAWLPNSIFATIGIIMYTHVEQ